MKPKIVNISISNDYHKILKKRAKKLGILCVSKIVKEILTTYFPYYRENCFLIKLNKHNKATLESLAKKTQLSEQQSLEQFIEKHLNLLDKETVNPVIIRVPKTLKNKNQIYSWLLIRVEKISEILSTRS